MPEYGHLSRTRVNQIDEFLRKIRVLWNFRYQSEVCKHKEHIVYFFTISKIKIFFNLKKYAKNR